MKVSYRTDLYANYMLIEIPIEADVQKYSFKMLEKNNIKGVLPSKLRFEDGKGYLYADITNKRNLVNIYKDREMHLEDMLHIFYQLFPIMEEVRNYLLTEKMMCFHPEYIYVDDEDESFYTVILPWQEKVEGYHKLAEFFLEKVNHKDENGVNAAYHFYRQQSQESFSFSQFLPILEKENILKRQKKSKEEKADMVPSIPEKYPEIENISKDQEQEEGEKTFVNKKIFFLILSVFMMGLSCLTIIPDIVKISFFAFAVLFLIVFFYCLWVHPKTIKEKSLPKKEEWEVGETVFFEEEQEEIYKLQWKEKGRTKQIILKEFPCKVGKIKEEVDIVISDATVSRIHCQFLKKDNRIFIMDLQSTNGTCLNGLTVKDNEIMEIEKNDEILIGKVKVLVV